MVTCPYCKSKAVFRFTRDEDFGGACRYEPVNEEQYYSREQLLRNETAPDMDVYHCANCGSDFDICFDSLMSGTVSVEALLQRKKNLEETIVFQTKHYNTLCNSIRNKIWNCSNSDLAKKADAWLNEIRQQYTNLEKLNEQVELIEYIIQKDSVPSLPTYKIKSTN